MLAMGVFKGFPLRGSYHEVTDEVSMSWLLHFSTSSASLCSAPSPQGEGFKMRKTPETFRLRGLARGKGFEPLTFWSVGRPLSGTGGFTTFIPSESQLSISLKPIETSWFSSFPLYWQPCPKSIFVNIFCTVSC